MFYRDIKYIITLNINVGKKIFFFFEIYKLQVEKGEKNISSLLNKFTIKDT